MFTYLGNTDHHVVNKRFECSDGTSLFVTSVPHLNSNVKALLLLGGHFHNSDVDSDVAEILRDLTSWTSNYYLSCFDGNSDYTKKPRLLDIPSYTKKLITYLHQ